MHGVFLSFEVVIFHPCSTANVMSGWSLIPRRRLPAYRVHFSNSYTESSWNLYICVLEGTHS